MDTVPKFVQLTRRPREMGTGNAQARPARVEAMESWLEEIREAVKHALANSPALQSTPFLANGG